MSGMRTTLLLAGLTGLLLVAGQAIGGQQGVIIALIFAAAMNFGSYWFSDKLVLKIYHARPAGPEEAPVLYSVVRELASRAGLPTPKVYLIPSEAPNAFATGRNPEHGVVAVTEGIMQLLSERELKGVIAHEMAHIKNRDILVATIAAGIAAAVTYIANAAQFAFMFGGNRSDDEEGGSSPLGALFMLFVAPIAATLIQLGISRSREYLADETAARLTGDPEALARALEKLERGAQRIPAHVEPATASLFIVSPLAGRRSLLSLFSTHPPMQERIARLRGMSSGGLRPAVVA